jgi:hypothetical protein
MTIKVIPALGRIQILDPPANSGGAVSGKYESVIPFLEKYNVRALVYAALQLRCKQVTLEVD